jgi:hypothetical protein
MFCDFGRSTSGTQDYGQQFVASVVCGQTTDEKSSGNRELNGTKDGSFGETDAPG